MPSRCRANSHICGDGPLFGPHPLIRKSHEAGEERPSRRDIETVTVVRSLGAPPSDDCGHCRRVTQKDGPARVKETRAAIAAGGVHRETQLGRSERVELRSGEPAGPINQESRRAVAEDPFVGPVADDGEQLVRADLHRATPGVEGRRGRFLQPASRR